MFGRWRSDEGTIDSARAECREHEETACFAPILMARRAGVPAAVVQLIPLVGHGQPVDDLAVCRACRVHINRSHIVGRMAICVMHPDCSHTSNCIAQPGLATRE